MTNEMSLDDRINHCCVAGCTCLTKTPDPKYHDLTCRYRTLIDCQTAISERNEIITGLLHIFDSVTQGQERELKDKWIPIARSIVE